MQIIVGNYRLSFEYVYYVIYHHVSYHKQVFPLLLSNVSKSIQIDMKTTW